MNSDAPLFCYGVHRVESAEWDFTVIGNVKINGKKRKTEEKGVKCSITKDFPVTSAHTHFPHHDERLLSADPQSFFHLNCH